MVLRPELEIEAEAIFHKWGLDFAIVGKTTDTLRFVIKHHGEVMADLPIKQMGDEASVDRDAAAPTSAVEAQVGQVLHVRFRPAGTDQVVAGFQALKELIHERPGETGVVLHIPCWSGPGAGDDAARGRGVRRGAGERGEWRIGAMAELRLV